MTWCRDFHFILSCRKRTLLWHGLAFHWIGHVSADDSVCSRSGYTFLRHAMVFHRAGHDSFGFGRLLAIGRIGDGLLAWIFTQLVAQRCRLTRLAWFAIHDGFPVGPALADLLPSLAQLHAHVTGYGCGTWVIFAHISELLAIITKLFAHLAQLFALVSKLLPHVAELFSNFA